MTVTHRKNKVAAEQADHEPGTKYHCDVCGADITLTVRVQCAGGCSEFDLCGTCFCSGAEVGSHRAWHAYRVIERNAYPIFTDDWGADEELLLIDGCRIFGLGNWADIADHIGNRTADDVERHYISVFLEGQDGTPEGEIRAQDEQERLTRLRAAQRGGPLPPDEAPWEQPPIVGPNMHFHPHVTADEFQRRKRARIDALRKTQQVLVSQHASQLKSAKPLVSAPTSHHEVAGFMAGRLEFDNEYEQDAENLNKDMEFGRVYRFGGDQIKTVSEALGEGQQAVQGKARMPPSARGNAASRTNAGERAAKGNKGTSADDAPDADATAAPDGDGDAEGDGDGDGDADGDGNDTGVRIKTEPEENGEAEEQDMEESRPAPDPDADPDPDAMDVGDETSQQEQAEAPTRADSQPVSALPALGGDDAAATPSAADASASAAAASAGDDEEKPGDWDEDDADLLLKLTILDMYHERLDRRERRKRFLFERNLIDYRRNVAAERRRPKEERDLLHRIRHFSQLMSGQDFEDFYNGLCYEDALRRQAAQLQRWRRAGITSLADGVQYEQESNERARRAAAIAEGGLAALPHLAHVAAMGSPGASGAAGAMRKGSPAQRGRESSVSLTASATAVDPLAAAGPPGRKNANAGRTISRPLDLSADPNLGLLSEVEQKLCSEQRIRPATYLTVKRSILVEQRRRDGKLERKDVRAMFKLDPARLAKVYAVLEQQGLVPPPSRSSARPNGAAHAALTRGPSPSTRNGTR